MIPIGLWIYIVYLNYDKFECTDDKKDNIIFEEEQEVMDKIKHIIEKNKIPDIMSVSKGITNFSEKPKINDIVCYDENSTYVNSVHTDSDYFDKITSGAFILCRNLDTLNLIKKEITKKNYKENKVIFNLIVTGSSCEKIINYLQKDNKFDSCITNICIHRTKPEKYQYLKEKYSKIHDDIYKKRKDVVKFINKNSREDINPFPITKLITYEEYIEIYKERHIKISEFYGDLNPDIYQKQIGNIKNFIEIESKDDKLKLKDSEKLYNGFLTFNIKKDLENIDNSDNNDLDTSSEASLITEYIRNSFYKDMNNWLLKPKDKYYYESIAYFTARLMYALNSYAMKKNK